MSNYLARYRNWLESESVSAEDREILLSMKDNDVELQRSFSEYMAFGTGGLRSTMGPGTAKMNVYTVAHTTQAIAELIIEENGQSDGVAIAFDSRNNSELFAKTAASVLAANNIKVYIFDSVRPTPELSFALLDHGCIAGINITASHNPKEYNGYKVYWKDGAQLPVNHAQTVTDKAAGLDIFKDVKRTDFDNAVRSGIIEIIGEATDKRYLSALAAQVVDSNAIKAAADSFKVVYTPLHGAGYKLVPEILSIVGVKHLYTVPEQMILDGNFPTVDKPNPEYPEVFTLGKKIANDIGSDLIIATDPDADRLAVTVRKADGEFATLTGNQVGLLLMEYIISAYEANGTMPNAPFAVKSIVSSKLADAICKAHGVTMYNVLTGFKYIGEMIKLHDGKDGSYIFGFEESCGYLKGTYARDKDGVGAAMLICEMAAKYSLEGKTLYTALEELYAKYGYSFEKTEELTTEGIDAKQKQEALMEAFRSSSPKAIGGIKTLTLGDLKARKFTNLITGDVDLSSFPAADVLLFELETGDTIVVRPSGTEPKVKFYYLITAPSRDEALARYTGYSATIKEFVASI